ncbi:glycosyltransferase [Candidatus Gottesmanbacteria bacterium]|nr:glycosyltransferase [Candidatus Gottesmanbacteria bacterium]
MRLALLASNYYRIDRSIAKGTEAFVYEFARALDKRIKETGADIDITAFASADSDLPFPIVSNHPVATTLDPLVKDQKTVERALVTEAFSRAQDFDIYCVHISNGESVLPLIGEMKKPVLISLHGGVEMAYDSSLFAPLKELKHVHFVSISDAQRRRLPDLPYMQTIHHGIDEKVFQFNPIGGERMVWAGRGVAEKGLGVVLDVVTTTKHSLGIAVALKDQWKAWYETSVEPRIETLGHRVTVSKNLDRAVLPAFYCNAKLFLFPVGWEEPFGLVTIESMAVGTPVVAYARGSLSEIIEDGKTGFLVNPSESDIRGDFIVKKTGVEGLKEAVERIYAMSVEEYKAMRRVCRTHVEEKFTLEKMVDSYIALYKKLVIPR